MRTSMEGLGRLRAGCLAAAGVVSVLMGLAGCATPPPPDTGASSQVVTPSDETEARRRARIRIELASGYF